MTALKAVARRSLPRGAAQETSSLGRLFATGKPNKAKVERLCESGGLEGITAREAQRAIELLQHGATHLRSERAIVRLLEALSPLERAVCLRLMDGGADRHTVSRLMGKDIDDPALKRQAQALIDSARPFMPSNERVIVSDFDDTIRPHADKRAKGREVFKGARALLNALDSEPSGAGSLGDLHVVTGRDGFWAGTERELERADIHPNSVAYTSAGSGLLSLFGNYDGIKKEKIKNIEKLLDRNSGGKALLFGDSVQADAEVFGRVMESRADRVELALIHRVPGYPVAPEVEADPRFVVFDDYAEAARALQARGLISEVQLAEVLKDFDVGKSD